MSPLRGWDARKLAPHILALGKYENMNLIDVKLRFDPLIDDVEWAKSNLITQDNQNARRAYIRSLFAFIEGSIWILKQIIVNVVAKTEEVPPAELALLSDISFELKSNGEVKESTKYLRLPDNIKFTFKTLDKYYKNGNLDINEKDWSNFQVCLKVRNRITHPKKIEDLEVSSSEIICCDKTYSWFCGLVIKYIQGLPRE
jgi:hypothetical protein